MKLSAFLRNIATAFTVATLVLPSSAYAAVLGTPIYKSEKAIAPQTKIVTEKYNDPNVGNQVEHYAVYSPNPDSYPLLSNGWTAYGSKTLSKTFSILQEQGYSPVVGINADFFSFLTGVPMSNTLIDGRIFTADSGWIWGIGFNRDGTAFTSIFPIQTQITDSEGNSFFVENINKYRQPYALYLLNSDYGSETHSPGWGRDIVLSDVSGELKLGGSITATVESISDNDGSVPIPEGKAILTVSADASQELKDRLACLDIGEKITIGTKACVNPELWNNAVYGLGCTGGKLITDGQLDLEDDSAAPRTAIGIRADGSIIFYTIDGRQIGYSFGARKETVAKRLLELGCVEAVNLDGGGSTVFGAVMPGTKNLKIISSPSDGNERKSANYMFIVKDCISDGIPKYLDMNVSSEFLLSGATTDVSVSTAYDSSYELADIPDNIVYQIIDDADTPDGSGKSSIIDSNGRLTVYGNGDVYIKATSDTAEGIANVVSIATPQSIEIVHAEHGYPLNELLIEPSTSVNLAAKSYWYSNPVGGDNSCYSWTVISDNASVGTVSPDGVFTASDISGATGRLAVHAGLCTVEIPIKIADGGSGTTASNPPTIDATCVNNTLNAVIKDGIFQKDDISVRLDAYPIDFNYDKTTGKITCDIPNDGKYHRIAIIANNGRLSAVKFLDCGNVNSVPNAFSDTATHWAKDYISYLASQEVVNGNWIDDQTFLFRPDNSMSRCEFAVMLCNYLELDTEEYASSELPCIDAENIPFWAENQVKAIYATGLMKGQLAQYGIEFNPNSPINRMEFSIVLSRLLPTTLPKTPISYSDASDIPFWAEESMRTVCTQGIMTGYPDGTIKPLRDVTRAEACKMMFNIYGVYELF